MSGIVGWAGLNRNMSAVRKMVEALHLRGTDETGYWFDQYAGFGHRRLIVSDSDGGQQPMARDRCGKQIVICYDGRLMNAGDVRSELMCAGYRFRGASDAEVVLNAYLEWGIDCLSHLNGAFAFSIWDARIDRLFVARDRFGVRPLFYFHRDGDLLFSSEIKGLLATGVVNATIDSTGLTELLGFGPSRVPGSGVFKGVQELKPAHYLLFSRAEGLKVNCYWRLTSKKHTDSYDETVEKVRAMLSDSVKRLVVADAPLCSFLSGGIDSSAITAIAANEYRSNGYGVFNTYSVDYEGNDEHFIANDFQPGADGHYIQLVQEKYGTLHHNCMIRQEDLVASLGDAMHARDLPGMADVDSSLLLFAKHARKDFSIALSGEGADEIFGGYPWFRADLSESIDGFPWMRATDLRSGLLNDEWRGKLALGEFVKNRYEETIAETPLLSGESKEEENRRKLFYLCMNYFMATLLERKDRMGMAAGLETRLPFADYRLVEYAWNIPWEMKNADGREKGILRDAVRDLLPQEIVGRKKSPYPKTHNPLYTELVQKQLKGILSGDTVLRELFDKRQLDELTDTGGSAFKRPWFGQLMSGPQLLAYFIQVHLWFEEKRVQIVY